jgi:hypothetical protein
MDDDKVRQEILEDLYNDPLKAHRLLFPTRHKDAEAECHAEIISLFNSSHKFVALQAFRGCGKSTLVEETAILKAAFSKKKYIMVVGPSYSSACERLFSIKNEFQSNDALIELFGNMQGEIWAADNIVLTNGCKIEAVGAGQALRGKKHGSNRPDLIIIDDLETEENTDTDIARMKVKRWFNRVLIPMMPPSSGEILFIGTPVHPKALIESKRRDASWITRVYPICYTDLNSGDEISMWPTRFPMNWVINKRNEYINDGAATDFAQEYMCRSEDDATKPFQANMIKVVAVPMSYMPVHIICDPARTVKKTSDRTGYVAASWIGSRLIVHDALGAFHRPDEIINTLFEWNEKYKPIYVGVESNSLEEFIMAPLRAKMLDKGISMPLLDLRAPKDKLEFLKGLQPFYMSGSVTHVKHLPDLESELLSFPTGRCDVVNALAYMLKLRSGQPVYEDFTAEHVTSVLEHSPREPRYLLVSSRPAMTAAVVVQVFDDTIRVYRDWVMNKPPAEAFENILRQAVAEFGEVKVGAPLEQFDKFLNNGLPSSAKSQYVTLQKYDSSATSERSLRPWLTKQHRGLPAFTVSTDARWTVNALGGGYARAMDKHGKLSDSPTDNQYRLVAEALESFVAFIDKRTKSRYDEEDRNYSYTSTGKRYLSTLPQGR